MGGLKGFDGLTGVEGTDSDVGPARGPVGIVLEADVVVAETGPVEGGRLRLCIVLPQLVAPRPPRL